MTSTDIQLEIERLSADLALEFHDVPTDVIARDVRSEFARRSSSPIQDFIPIFVQRRVRERLRGIPSDMPPAMPAVIESSAAAAAAAA